MYGPKRSLDSKFGEASMYDFVTGPMFYVAFFVFVIGLLVRVGLYIRGLDWKLDRVAYSAFPAAGVRGAARSILFWLSPLGTRSWRTQPFMTIISFVFHLGVVLVPPVSIGPQPHIRRKIGNFLVHHAVTNSCRCPILGGHHYDGIVGAQTDRIA